MLRLFTLRSLPRGPPREAMQEPMWCRRSFVNKGLRSYSSSAWYSSSSIAVPVGRRRTRPKSEIMPLKVSPPITSSPNTMQSAQQPDTPIASTASILENWPGTSRLGINRVNRLLQQDETLAAEAAKEGIDIGMWRRYNATYRRKLMKDPIGALGGDADGTLLPQLVRVLQPLSLSEASGVKTKEMSEEETIALEFVFTTMLADALSALSPSLDQQAMLEHVSDLRLPHEWYPRARIQKRKIIYHGGPTNSGKTYQALQRLRTADPEKGGGLYCGPLRLLALEVYENLNRQGVYTNLITGQEKREVPFSTHTSNTLEMVNMSKSYDVAVVDEIQMIGDAQRGYAWTRVVLGLCANEIHLCGGMEALEVVKRLIEHTGDELVVEEYQRLGALEVEDESLRGDYSKILPGDCVVAFSKADIFSIRRQIERLTPYKCSTIYGQLPPETRSNQARNFNEGVTDVLVASDAIGMGLNLNIRRVVFHSVIKRGAASQEAAFIDPSNIKQIAGRAGRMSSKYKTGFVTTWQEADLAYVKAVMAWDILPIHRAGIFPSVQQIEMFSQQLELVTAEQNRNLAATEAEEDANDGVVSCTTSDLATILPVDEKAIQLSTLITRFLQVAQLDDRFFLCEHGEMCMVSNYLHTIPMSLADRFTFSSAPVSTVDELSMRSLYQFAAAYASGRPVALNVRMAHRQPQNVQDFSDLCFRHNVVDLYLWLSFRYPKYFIERELALSQKNYAVSMIQQSLDRISAVQHSHSDSYAQTRKKLSMTNPSNLPPHAWGNIRENTRIIMEGLKNGVPLTSYPHLREELQKQAAGAKYSNNNRPRPTKYIKPNDIAIVSAQSSNKNSNKMSGKTSSDSFSIDALLDLVDLKGKGETSGSGAGNRIKDSTVKL